MAQKKRQYGSGCLLEQKGGWIIRWRELEIAPDGTKKRVLRFERLHRMPRREASEILAQRMAAAGERRGPTRSRVPFSSFVSEWEATVLPMYKHSTQKNHRHIAHKHLVPKFGELALADVTPQAIQSYVAQLTQREYAPKTIDHIHDVLSAILRTAVKWGHLKENPARGIDLPKLTTVKPKWALTAGQAHDLLKALPPLAQTMCAVALLTGLRRGELFALRWQSVDLDAGILAVREAVYEGEFGTPKTVAGVRTLPLSGAAVKFLRTWRGRAKRTDATDLVFSTVSGKPISPNNVLRRWVFPACSRLGLANASWLTFRRTYASWAHEKGVPGKVLAAMMGHEKVDTSLNVYTQVVDGAMRTAAQQVGGELFTIVHSEPRARELTR